MIIQNVPSGHRFCKGAEQHVRTFSLSGGHVRFHRSTFWLFIISSRVLKIGASSTTMPSAISFTLSRSSELYLKPAMFNKFVLTEPDDQSNTGLFMNVPTAHEDVVGPHHGQRQQMVQLLQLKVVDVPQDELPPGIPVFFAFPVTPKRLYLFGQNSVLLNKILHVCRSHRSNSPIENNRDNFRGRHHCSSCRSFFNSDTKRWRCETTTHFT